MIPFQLYYLLGIILVFGGIALAMYFSVKKHNEKMAQAKKKKRRR